jgi:hypothetical protein
MAEDFETIRAALKEKVIASVTKDKIPTVDPEDLKSLWNLETELEEITAPYKVEGQCSLFPLNTFGQVFKPGTDMESVYFRKAQLFFAIKFAEHGKIDFPYIHNGKPDDVVFKAFATVPMKGFHKGMGQFPYDMEELIRIIQNEPQGYTCNAFTIPEDVKADLRLSLKPTLEQI